MVVQNKIGYNLYTQISPKLNILHNLDINLASLLSEMLTKQNWTQMGANVSEVLFNKLREKNKNGKQESNQ